MIHSFHELFTSSIRFTSDLNQLFGRELFIPVLGDPTKSLILRAPEILNPFLQGTSLDEVLELAVFRDIFDAFPFRVNRPMAIITHSPWADEETHLIEVAARRFQTPEQIQRFVMPGRSMDMISLHFREEWAAGKPASKAKRPRKRTPEEEVEHQYAVVEQQDPDQPFVLEDYMKFATGQI
jgi:hypothetical protein